MDWIPLVLTPLLTGVLVYILQLHWQEQMEKRLTRFSNLHERRAEVVAQLYRLLVEMHSDLRYAARAVSHLTEECPDEEIQQRVHAAERSTEAFRDYFERHRIYLPESLVEKTMSFCAQTSATSIGILLVGTSRAQPPQNESQQQEYERLLEDISQDLRKRIPSLRQDIEREFRDLLGNQQ